MIIIVVVVLYTITTTTTTTTKSSNPVHAPLPGRSPRRAARSGCRARRAASPNADLAGPYDY
eukprot:14367994-Heterocapsa_arctica.AAC.1